MQLARAGMLSAMVVIGSSAEVAEAQEKVLLRYQFAPGQVLRYQISQDTQVERKVGDSTEKMTSRGNSIRQRKVVEIDSQGNAAVELSLLQVKLEATLPGSPPLVFESDKPDQASPAFAKYRRVVGRPLAVIKLAPNGTVLDQKPLLQDEAAQAMVTRNGQLALPLPAEPVAVGASWRHNFDVDLRLPTGEVRKLAMQQIFTLAQVQRDIATLEYKTAILTPLNDPALEAQVVQYQPEGRVEFDIRRGMVLTQELAVDKTVVGFAGGTSAMRILDRLTERLMPDGKQIGSAK